MKILTRVSFAVAAILFAGTAMSANQIHVTTESAKGGTMLAMDVVGDGAATAFQFTVKVPGLVASDKMNKSGCVAQLPKSFSAACKVVDGEVRIAAFDAGSKALPTSLMTVGTIFLPGVRLTEGKSASSLELSNVEFADTNGNALPFEGNVDSMKASTKAAIH